jgi:hypothetical protein
VTHGSDSFNPEALMNIPVAVRSSFLAVGTAAALAFGARTALAKPAAAPPCGGSSVGRCLSTADCKTTCQQLGFPITQAHCVYTGGQGCCYCGI